MPRRFRPRRSAGGSQRSGQRRAAGGNGEQRGKVLRRRVPGGVIGRAAGADLAPSQRLAADRHDRLVREVRGEARLAAEGIKRNAGKLFRDARRAVIAGVARLDALAAEHALFELAQGPAPAARVGRNGEGLSEQRRVVILSAALARVEEVERRLADGAGLHACGGVSELGAERGLRGIQALAAQGEHALRRGSCRGVEGIIDLALLVHRVQHDERAVEFPYLNSPVNALPS